MATKYVSALDGGQMDSALMDMATHTSEAWAVGTRNGTPVSGSDVTYHNNSKYWADSVYGYTERAEDAAARAEAAVPAGTAGAVFFDRAQTLTDAQKEQAKANISAGGTNPNLLMNAWFSVNQRGTTSGGVIGGSDYVSADRWKLFQTSQWSIQNHAVTVAWNGVGTATGILQYTGAEIGNPIKGKTATVSAYIDGTLFTKTITIPVAGGSSDFALSNNVLLRVNSDNETTQNRGVEVQFRTTSTTNIAIGPVKCELGSVSTLANDTPPDYGTELAKCQRYCVALNPYNHPYARFGIGYPTSTTGIEIFAPLTVPLRAQPTITHSGNIVVKDYKDITNKTFSSLSVGWQTSNSYVVITASGISGLTLGSPLVLQANNDSSAQIILSADL